jgi:hypothetical protein
MQSTKEARPPWMLHSTRLCRGVLPVKKSLANTLVQLMGCEAAEKLITEFGGTRIWVPVRSSPETKLSLILGGGAAASLCSRFGGDYLQVPNSRAGANICRRVADLHRQGCKINDIALAVGRSRRTVFRLLRKKITDLQRTGRLAADR